MHKRIWLSGAGAVLVGIAAVAFWRPVSPEEHFRRGLDALRANDLTQLQREAAALRSVPGFETRARLLQGALLTRVGNYAQALEALEAAAALQGTRPLALSLAGECCYRLGRLRDAERILLQAVSEDPGQAAAHRWLAATYYDLGAVRQAAAHLQRVAELDTRDGRPQRLLGLIYKDTEKFAEAVEAYRESLRRDPRPPDLDEIRLELGQALLQTQHPAEALEALADCAVAADVWAVRAECHHSLGQPRECAAALDRALELDSDHLDALVLRGTVALEESRTADAERDLSRAVKQHPTDFAARFKLAQVFQRTGRTEAAAEQMRLMEAHKKLRAHFTELHERAAVEPRDAEIRYELGVAARQLDRPELAQMWFRAALALAPDHERARRALNEK